LASTFCQQTTMMANRILVLFLACFTLGAAEPSTTCDLPAEAGTEAVMLASHVVLDDAESSRSDGNTSAPGPVTAMGDPHVVTSRGFKLDLNQPGDYTLLQVPHDGPALLQLEATVERSGMSCTFYITKARLLGAWFHEDTLKIRADNQDGQPFAIQMADAKPWTSLPDISSNNVTILKTYKHANVEVKVMAVQQTTKGTDSHKGPEGSFSVLVAKPGQPQAEQTIIKIAKGEQWLNIALTRLGNLGYSKMGGVLGTDVPNAKWTELPDDCKMFHELQGENVRRKDITAELEPNSDASILWY